MLHAASDGTQSAGLSTPELPVWLGYGCDGVDFDQEVAQERTHSGSCRVGGFDELFVGGVEPCEVPAGVVHVHRCRGIGLWFLSWGRRGGRPGLMMFLEDLGKKGVGAFVLRGAQDLRGGPLSTTTPWSIKTTWSLTCRAKPSSWVTTTMVIPASDRDFITSSTSPTSSGSSAEVGSSKSMSLGFMASARAIAIRCCCPPESSWGRSVPCCRARRGPAGSALRR